jgi:hypothetical protein
VHGQELKDAPDIKPHSFVERCLGNKFERRASIDISAN